ncbi:MAG: cyclic nucleotide-binding domain-containing protein [Leptospiraceae bacterium]|nr:cyclic nucleotide-binding domain-containing protein [Leptospiraceae bacterium]MDW7976004.1 cyclic nucleotide-binding domain-containing protein [Leptospiraceae bacterium]
MQLEDLKQDGKILKFSKGEKIYDQKSYLSDIKVFYILKGQVLLRKKYTSLVKDEFLLQEGELFGFLEIYHSKIRLMEAEAKTDVEVIGMDRITFERLIISNMELSLKVIRNLSKILRTANQRIKHLPK